MISASMAHNAWLFSLTVRKYRQGKKTGKQETIDEMKKLLP